MANNKTSKSKVNADSSIIDVWPDGYVLKLTFTAGSNGASNWETIFNFPYEIREVHGVRLFDHGNGNYTVSGENNDKKDLSSNQSITAVFVVDGDGQNAVLPKFYRSSSSSSAASHEPVEVVDVVTSQPQTTNVTNVIDAQPENGGRVISVDKEYGGSIKEAIANAQDGDVVQLENKTYYTSSIYLDKDITLTGKPNTVIDGGGTHGTVIKIVESASGATIQNLEITNAKNGIYSNRAYNLTLQNLDISNIGKLNVDRQGQNNIGITANHANGLRLLDSTIENMGRSGVNVGDTDGAVISGITVKDVNLEAQHAQSHDAAGIKFFNTNDILLKDSYFSDINANHIWNDTTTNTTMDNNTIEKVGEDFLRPTFNPNVDITGIYNEKSHNSIVTDNRSSAVGEFTAFRATEYTTQTMTMENNDFSKMEMGSTDYWVNETVEILIAETENPSQADFSLFSNEYYQHMNIG